MTESPIRSAMVTVIDRNRCIGFLLARGPAGVEAFGRDEHSLGLFPDERAAIAAVWRQAHGQRCVPEVTP
jgi:hypothetical protein